MGTWIESHAELATHHKLARLKRSLKITRVAAVGHLHLLWWWAALHAETGDLSRLRDDDIADAAEWEDDSSQFVRALMDAGFLNDDGSLHDWNDYFGKMLTLREKAKTRAARGRDRARTQPNCADDTEPCANVPDSSANVRERSPNFAVTDANVRDSSEHVRRSSHVDLDLDLNQDLDLKGNTNVKVQGIRSPQAATASAGRPEEPPFGWQNFWEAYPRKVAKPAALRAWKSAHINQQTAMDILDALDRFMAYWKSDKCPIDKIPHPATWITQRRWEDEIIGQAQPHPADARESMDAFAARAAAAYAARMGQ